MLTGSVYFPNHSRPKSVDEVAFQEEVVAMLKKSLEGADVSSITSGCNLPLLSKQHQLIVVLIP